ncbi:MoaD/ThiS family protein [Novosphingobium sp. FSY-8]|uniref:MoaD/ThiS family protein n=1 Tax=Novosphingobium ovatum TaxID=1908523 RepID=A0ABW9XD68_9SPHN|nr:MoaD/ThiS family protein [Novosphingobium ovatum]NBC36484.1 MoaD/ThiS family protein [Novosphingobium ovatum]
MSARLVFLGRLADVAGAGALEVAPGALADVLAGLGDDLARALTGPRIRLAHNGALVDGAGLVLADGDELAFLPPVSGG